VALTNQRLLSSLLIVESTALGVAFRATSAARTATCAAIAANVVAASLKLSMMQLSTQCNPSVVSKTTTTVTKIALNLMNNLPRMMLWLF